MLGGIAKRMVLCAVFLLIFSSSHQVHAVKDSAVGFKPPLVTCTDYTNVIDDEALEKLGDFRENDANIAEKQMIDFIDTGYTLFNINPLSNLFFGNPYCGWADKEDEEVPDLYYGIFTEFEFDVMISSLNQIFIGSYTLFVLIALMVISLRAQVKMFSPQSRNDFWEDIKMVLFSAILMVAIYPILHFLLYLNYSFLAVLRTYLEDLGIDMYSFSIMNTTTFDSFFLVIVGLSEWVLAAYINLIYFLRKVLIVLIFMLAPLACISLIYPTTRGYFSTWVRDLIGLIFLQSIHGLLMFVILLLNDLYATNNVFFKLALLMLFIPLTSMVTQILKLGDSSNLTGQAANVMGAGALYKSAKLLGQTGKQIRSVGRATNGRTTLSQAAAQTRISTTAQGTHSKAWQTAKNGASKIGGGLGAMAGSPLGALGMAGGAAIGTKLGSGLMQMGRNATVGIGSVASNIGAAFNYSGNNAKGIKGAFNNLQERRRLSGNLGESVGSIFGLGGAGKKAGEALSGVSAQRLMQAPIEKGGFGGMTLSDLGKILPPNQDIQWRQSNEGSAFFLKNDDGSLGRQISPMGEADTNLRGGEFRSMDYRLGGESALRQNENGNYSTPGGGFSGSTPDLLRSSNPVITDSQGSQFNDTRMKGNEVKPDSYFSHAAVGVRPESMSDRVANKISGWSPRDNQNANRHNGVL